MTLEEAILEMRSKVMTTSTGQRIQSYLHSRIVAQFTNLRQGGSDRGVTWAPFKTAWYTRSDGTTVSIYGGVPKLSGRGKVKAKLRSKIPGGKKRYKPGDALIQSTGILKGALLSDMRISGDGIELNTPVPYAVWQNNLRSFAHVTSEESKVIAGMIAGSLT